MKNLLSIGLLFTVGVFGMSTGCAKHTTLRPSFPKSAIPQPLGTFVRQWRCEQRNKATPERFAVYLADWRGDSADLATAAKRQLTRALRQHQEIVPTIHLESSGELTLDESRRIALAELLAADGIDATDMIEIADSGKGLRGDESMEVNAGRTQQALSQSNGFTGFVGQGFQRQGVNANY